MLTIRQAELIRILLKYEKEISSRELAKMLEITTRTVRNDIKVIAPIIEGNGAKIIAIPSKGYTIQVKNSNKFNQFLSQVDFTNTTEENDGIPTEPTDRIYYIIDRLLYTEGYLKLIDLADELYISESTIKKDLKEVKNQIESFGLILEKKPNYGLKLIGKEEKLRYCMTYYSFSNGQNNIDQKIYDKIYRIVTYQVRELGAPISQEGIIDVARHLLTAMQRMHEQYYTNLTEESTHLPVLAVEYKIAKNIVKDLEVTFDQKLPQTEMIYIAMHLLGAKLITYEHTNQNELMNHTYVYPRFTKISKELIARVDQHFGLALIDDQDLIYGLSLHIKRIFYRLKFGMGIHNSLLAEIKLKQPFAFDIGIYLAEHIQKQFQREVNEDEAGYLAVHIAASIERSKMKHFSKKCIIVSPTGSAATHLLFYKLKTLFENKLEIIDVIDIIQLDSYALHKLDFIISVPVINEELSIPVVQVNTILGTNDINKIKSLLKEESKDLLQYTDPSLTFFRKNFKKKEEVLDFLIKELENQGMVDESFAEAIYDREARSSTCFGNLVAIPHPMRRMTNKTFWAICTLKNPISWDDRRVQFVCMLSVQKNYNQKLQEMFSFLVSITEDLKLVEQLVNVKTFEDFLPLIQNKVMQP